MNRGQQQQRPPTLPQVPPSMQYSRAGGPVFSAAYPLPPQRALQQQQQQQQQNYPAMQSRTTHQILPTTPSYLQSRGGSGNYFGAPTSGMNLPMQPSPNTTLPSLQQPSQSSLALHQQQQQQAQQQHAQQQAQQQQQQAALHLGGASTQLTGTSSNSSDNVIDQNEFPPLGSTGTPQSSNAGGASSGQGNFHSTYASQAGTAIGNGVTGLTGGGGAASTPQRDFGHDDFPPLGGQSTTQHSQGSQDGHTNGFAPQSSNPSQDQSQAQRSLMLAGQHGGQNAIGQTAAGVQSQRTMPGLTSEMDKRNFSKMNPSSHTPWSSQPTGTQGFPSALSNGQHLGAPPNLPAPTTYNGQGFASQQQPQTGSLLQMQQSLQQQVQDMNSLPQQTRQPAGSQASGQPSSNHAPPANSQSALPQTPAQQILLSAADRWGLIGLLASIKGTDPDAQLLGSGTDLAQIGLDLTTSGHLSSTFITPWSDSSAAQSIEPEFHLPQCYQVSAPAPGPQKVGSFSDETLFFMFYSSPRDTLQEVAAQELYNRNWRYHKEARFWLTKETGQSPLQKDAAFERGTYTFFDPERWEKVKKEAVIYYEQLEERALPQSLNAMNMSMAGMPMPVGAAHGMIGMQVGAGQQQAQQLSMRG